MDAEVKCITMVPETAQRHTKNLETSALPVTAKRALMRADLAVITFKRFVKCFDIGKRYFGRSVAARRQYEIGVFPALFE